MHVAIRLPNNVAVIVGKVGMDEVYRFLFPGLLRDRRVALDVVGDECDIAAADGASQAFGLLVMDSRDFLVVRPILDRRRVTLELKAALHPARELGEPAIVNRHFHINRNTIARPRIPQRGTAPIRTSHGLTHGLTIYRAGRSTARRRRKPPGSAECGHDRPGTGSPHHTDLGEACVA